ncbi:MAG: Lrp/AsnC family transcriptional regulator [Proteobacteria bacterium]|nr:Lrp/AsnC family transcriptional regulator [Pseudomonadota bacterium]
MKIDKTDTEIISCLNKNGRISNNEIASKLSISEGTVRNRIKKLTENNYLKVKGLVNPSQIKDKQVIFLGARVAVSKDLEKTAKAVSKLPNVNATSVVAGRYDLIIEVFLEPYAVIDFISKDLGQLETIVSTESFLTLKNYNKWV